MSELSVETDARKPPYRFRKEKSRKIPNSHLYPDMTRLGSQSMWRQLIEKSFSKAEVDAKYIIDVLKGFS